MAPASQMRLRITRQLFESIDGIQFSAFRAGYVYQVGPTVGNYLLAVGAAEPAADDETYIDVAREEQLFRPRSARADRRLVAAPSDLAIAADRPPRSRRRRMKDPFVEMNARVNALAAELKRIKRHLRGLRHAI